MRIWADKPESGAVSEYWQKRRASCSLKPACTHYGSNWLVWTQSTVRILTKHRNKIQSLTYLISFYSLWIREGKSWYCTPYGSELVSPGPEYSQDTVLSSETRYIVYLIIRTHYESNQTSPDPRYCQDSWHKLRSGCCLQLACTNSRSGRIRPNPRYCQNSLHNLDSRLVPIVDPDGYIQTWGTVRKADLRLETHTIFIIY